MPDRSGAVADFFGDWRMLKSDRGELSGMLHGELIDAYEIGLQDQLKALDLDRTPELANKGIGRRLKGESNRYATSMHRTYNQELFNKLTELDRTGQLTEANVRSWFDGWHERKAEQAAAQTELSGYNQAAQDFVKRNGDKLTGEARIVPLTAAEPICAALIARNPYKLEEMSYVSVNPHINCVHSWSTSYKLRDDIAPDSIWAGR